MVRCNMLIGLVMIITSPFISAAEKRGVQIVKSSGDILYIALPATSLLSSLSLEKKTTTRYLQQHITVAGMTLALKGMIERERPDGSNLHSFPSGHTSMAFSGASLLTHQYGWKAGIPAALLATWTGYSRVYADKHYWSDVIAGAGLALLTHDSFFHRTGIARFQPYYMPSHSGVIWHFRFP